MDNLTPDRRSELMASVKSKDTKPEVIVRSFLHKRGFRFRKDSKLLPGRPDIVLKKYNAVIFVNGCFWHQHPGCRKANIPKSNSQFWEQKLKKNVERDLFNRENLKNQGWRVFTIWECEISEEKLELLAKYLVENRNAPAPQEFDDVR